MPLIQNPESVSPVFTTGHALTSHAEKDLKEARETLVLLVRPYRYESQFDSELGGQKGFESCQAEHDRLSRLYHPEAVQDAHDKAGLHVLHVCQVSSQNRWGVAYEPRCSCGWRGAPVDADGRLRVELTAFFEAVDRTKAHYAELEAQQGVQDVDTYSWEHSSRPYAHPIHEGSKT